MNWMSQVHLKKQSINELVAVVIMMPLNCCGNMSVVQVSDQLHNTTTSVIVNVLDDNDNAPVFTQSSYEVDFQSYYWQMSIKSST